MFADGVLVLTAAAVVVSVIFLSAVCFFFADADISLLALSKFGKPVRSLKGKVVWVTGAASGIGRQLANQLADNGVKLVLSDINRDKLDTVRDECLARSSLKEKDILVLPFDLTNTVVHQECLAKVVSHFKRLDIMFHNAGCTCHADYANITDQVDREVFDINCFGHVSLSRLILKHFLQVGGGHFVATSSGFGKFGYPRASTYIASKHALMGYFSSLRLEYATKGILVTIICPGPVFSGLYDKIVTERSGEFQCAGMQATDRRMPASRCAQLILLATANKVEEAWPSIQPALLWFYLNQYAPTIATRIGTRLLTPENADGLRHGKF